MQTISIHTGLTDPATGKPMLQVVYTSGLEPEQALVYLRQAESHILSEIVERAEQRGREQAQQEDYEG